MADDGRATLQAAVRALVEATKLPDGPRKDDKEQDCFVALKTALITTRKDSLALEGFLPDDMRSTLQSVARRGQKKMRAPQCREVLTYLFVSPSWLRAAQGDGALLASFQELFKSDAAALERLSSAIVEDARPAKAEGPDEIAIRRKALEEARTQREKMEQELAAGLAVMRGFGFRFPVDKVGSTMDQATEGFTIFYDGLVKADGLVAKGERPPDLLQTFAAPDNEGIMSFLSTMYHCGSRKTMSGRMKFVTDKLLALSPSFKASAEEKGWRLIDEVTPPLPPPAAVDSREELAQAAAAPAAPAPPSTSSRTPKTTRHSVIAWVDFTAKAWESSLLASETVKLMGFLDSREHPAVWDDILGTIGDMVASRDSSLDVLICNRKHLESLQDIVDCCEAEGNAVPLVILSTRDAGRPMPDSIPPGVHIKIFTDWRQVEQEAKQEVERRQRERAAMP